MFLTILGTVPYMVVGVVLATVGINWTAWQFWVILLSMLASDAISYFKARDWS